MLRGYVCRVNTLGSLFISAASQAKGLNLNRILLQNCFSRQNVQTVFNSKEEQVCLKAGPTYNEANSRTALPHTHR